MGEVLSAWYRNCPNVTVDNRAMKRKYYPYGVNLIGLTHGYYEKFSVLTNLMPLEVPDLWAASKYREWHVGDKHHKKDMQLITMKKIGMVIRILRSLSAPSAWAFDKGFVGSLTGRGGLHVASDKGADRTVHSGWRFIGNAFPAPCSLLVWCVSLSFIGSWLVRG